MIKVAPLIIIPILFSICDSMGQDFDSELNAISENYNLVGLATGVRCNGEIVGEHYSGLRNIEAGLPVDENTRFRIASISKAFTAAGLLTLYDEGNFDLDDDISEALGYEVVNPNHPDIPITYRMLLSHQSSLQDGSGYAPFLESTYSTFPVPNISEVILPDGSFYTENMWRTEEPGTYFAYSNLNYGLIGTLVETISGTRFDSYMEQQILQPLGIEGSFDVSELEDIENLAVLYRDNTPQADNYNGENPDSPITGFYTPGTNGSLFAPQGGLRCSLSELLNFGEMLVNNGSFEGQQILEPETAALMLSDQWTYDQSNGDSYFGLFTSWGLGIHRAGNTGAGSQIIPGEIVYGHPGEAYGLISDLYVHPNSGLVFAFITNGYSSGGGYPFGDSTEFYAPEEDAFEVIYEFFWEDCNQPTGVYEPERTNFCDKITYNSESEILKLPEENFSMEIGVMDVGGKRLDQGQYFQQVIQLNTPKGVSVVKVTADDYRCVFRTFSP